MHTIIQYLIMMSSFGFWFYIDIGQKQHKLVKSALIHGIICGIGINSAYVYRPYIIYNYTIEPELYDIYIIVPLISFGYGFYDLYIGIKNKRLDGLIHGLLFSTTAMYAYLNDNILVSYVFLITETSSVFLNLMVFRKKWVDVLFALTFFLYRIILAPLLACVYLSDQTNKNLTFGYITFVSVTLLNVYWFYFIIKKVAKSIQYLC